MSNGKSWRTCQLPAALLQDAQGAGIIKISATIIARDEERRIGGCIRSLSFCDEVIVVDSGSTDETRAIAASLGATVRERPYAGTNDQKEFARTLAAGPWVLNLDADEEAEAGLGDELRAAIAAGGFAAFTIPFKSFMAGRPIRFGRFRSTRRPRAFHKDAARYDTAVEPHDRLIVGGAIGHLHRGVVHHTYDDLDDAREKSARYARLAARAIAAAGTRPAPGSAILSPAWRFVKEAVLQLGVLDGADGVRLAWLSAREAHQKYVEAVRLMDGPPSSKGKGGP